MTVRFRSDIRQWTDGAALAAHLWQHDAALGAWWRALVLHHTVAPTLAQWRGVPTRIASAAHSSMPTSSPA